MRPVCQPNACIVTLKSLLNLTGSVMCQRYIPKKLPLAFVFLCLSSSFASASPTDPLWQKAVEITARNNAWVAGTMTIRAEAWDGKDGDKNGKSVSIGIDDNPFNPDLQQGIEARNLGEVRTIEGKACMTYSFTLKRKDGTTLEGTPALDLASGAPVEVSYVMKPLPFGTKSMNTVTSRLAARHKTRSIAGPTWQRPCSATSGRIPTSKSPIPPSLTTTHRAFSPIEKPSVDTRRDYQNHRPYPKPTWARLPSPQVHVGLRREDPVLR